MSNDWPKLRVDDWEQTRDTLHMWTQIVGKIRLEKAPMVNHWWQTTLYVTPRGLSTGNVPDGASSFAVEFDFCSHRLHIQRHGGDARNVALEPKSVSVFYAETMEAMEGLGIDVSINTKPVEIEEAIPFEDDDQHHSYEPGSAQRFWRQLVQADRVMNEFRGWFVGKASPVHFFWGSFDLASTRFSGRTAPRHPGGVPNCGDWVMEEAYSHELSSCGFWPGGADEGAFYSYAYPEGDGFSDVQIQPSSAFYSQDNGQYLLPYESVRRADDPDAHLMSFLQSTYEAAAETGGWDRDALERRHSRSHVPATPGDKA
jgi:hypothetical protein